MVASSIEVARRGYKKFEKGWFYPALELLQKSTNQWKDELIFESKTWVEVHEKIKNAKMRYRVQLKPALADAVSRFRHPKSYILLYKFI